ncbi:MAG: hypothetical protein NWR72_08055 [Bacteroidia bacterium]|nr:hypothetical protein [Bacteroidia bacterium]
MMIEIARYDTLSEANAFADILKRAGIMCSVEQSGWMDDGEGDWLPEYGQYALRVHREDEEDAHMVLASASDWEVIPEPAGEKNMLIGGVLSGIGLLTSMGDFTGIGEPWSWIPYGMIAGGAWLFYRGTREEKENG